MPDLAVGSKVWIFDDNRRVYRSDKSGPIYREHFVERVITGETSRSWVIGSGYRVDDKKFPKKGKTPLDRKGVYVCEQEIELAVWDRVHRYRVAQAVERCETSILRQVAVLVGYVEKPEAT